MEEIFEFDESLNDDEKAEIDPETIIENKEDINIKLVLKFKDLIAKEPEYYAIYSLSSYKILQEFLYPDKDIKLKHFMLSDFQLELFEELFYNINGYYTDDENYHKIGKKIYNLLYI